MPGMFSKRNLKWISSAAVVVALAIALSAAARNGRQADAYARYVPSEPLARQALDTALAAWKRGEPVGPLAIGSPSVAIEFSDSQRSAGRRLADYEIAGEIGGEGPRSFSVRLDLDERGGDERGGERVRYYVAGINPLWVFHERDYDAVIHWEACDVEPIDAAPQKAAPRNAAPFDAAQAGTAAIR